MYLNIFVFVSDPHLRQFGKYNLPIKQLDSMQWYRIPCLVTCLLLLLSHWVTSNSFVNPWTVACQAPLSMGLPSQEYWSGLTFSSPGDLSDPGFGAASPALAGVFFTTEPPGKSITWVSLIDKTLSKKQIRRAVDLECIKQVKPPGFHLGRCFIDAGL